VPVTVANWAELMLGVVSVGLATVVAKVDAPVMVPLPLIVIGMAYPLFFYRRGYHNGSLLGVPCGLLSLRLRHFFCRKGHNRCGARL
jgi:hypothetical protein